MTALRGQGAADRSWRGRGLLLSGVIVVLWTVFHAGCAGKDYESLRPEIAARGVIIEGVPFYHQTESTCGPAALASIFAFWGRPLSVEKIAAKIYLPELGGTLPIDMENFARETGFQTISANGTLMLLKEHIRYGTPVICLLDLGLGPYRQPHYVIVTGFDDAHAVLVEHDGLTADRLIGYDAFDKAWSRAGRWMLVIKPKKTETRHES
jgi:ABC-type bacteriocin/lantibiotic exporter with double-glycine peptidase domain